VVALVEAGEKRIFSDEATDAPKSMNINDYGSTNEYIHPICHYRDLVRGPESTSALRDYRRFFEPTKGGEGRFWWQLKGGYGKRRKVPEWIIMPHEENVGKDGFDGTVLNFERAWYSQCEKTRAVKDKLEKEGYKKDWLDSVDEKVDFSVGEKQGWVYP
jgi:hypothetical protein